MREYIQKAHDDFKKNALEQDNSSARQAYEDCRQRMEAILKRLDEDEKNSHVVHNGTVLEIANDIIHGDRLKHYGHPSINFERIAQSWSQYQGIKISPVDVCVMMILLKTQRMAEGYHRDSVIDIAGYAALAAIVEGDDEL